MWISYNFKNNNQEAKFFYVPVQSLPFKGNLIGYFTNSMEVYTSKGVKHEKISDEERVFCKQIDGTQEKIPDSIQNKFIINERMKNVLEKSNNLQEILCPDLVRVIIEDDSVLIFGTSLDENTKVRPEILFSNYEKSKRIR